MTQDYKNEFSLIQDFLENLHIPVHQIDATALGNSSELDPGIYAYFFKRESIERYVAHVLSSFDRHTLYKLTSNLLCQYYMFFLPGEKVSFACIGPFTEAPVTEAAVKKIMTYYNTPASRYNDLVNYYNSIRQLSDSNTLHTLLTTFCSRLWGGMDKYVFTELNMDKFGKQFEEEPSSNEDAGDHIRNMHILSERYAVENQIIQAISKGETHTTQMLVSKFEKMQTVENRSANPLRNRKNYTIIFNTLFRKAAELGKVHPIHIDRLSSSIAYKIEACQTMEELEQLRAEMIRKYCLLVRNHSMQNYSQLLQQTLTIINSDLTADLSLATLAAELNVNASYLSTRFKQEMDETLTDYIMKKRVEHAILLLNSTDMSISEIANRCGIPDLQYFSKVFKKRIGHTPSGYKKIIRQTRI